MPLMHGKLRLVKTGAPAVNNVMSLEPPGRHAMTVFRCLRTATIADLCALWLGVIADMLGQRWGYIFAGAAGEVALWLALFLLFFAFAFASAAKWGLSIGSFALFLLAGTCANLFPVLVSN